MVNFDVYPTYLEVTDAVWIFSKTKKTACFACMLLLLSLFNQTPSENLLSNVEEPPQSRRDCWVLFLQLMWWETPYQVSYRGTVTSHLICLFCSSKQWQYRNQRGLTPLSVEYNACPSPSPPFFSHFKEPLSYDFLKCLEKFSIVTHWKSFPLSPIFCPYSKHLFFDMFHCFTNRPQFKANFH